VTIVDIASNTAVKTLSLAAGAQPFDIAFTPDGKTAWVANSSTNTVQPIDVLTQTLGTPIPVIAGSRPSGLAITPDGRTMYIAENRNPATVQLLDLATRTILPTQISTGGNMAAKVVIVGQGTADLTVSSAASPAVVASGSNQTYTL